MVGSDKTSHDMADVARTGVVGYVTKWQTGQVQLRSDQSRHGRLGKASNDELGIRSRMIW